ncbi:MAG: glycoside hydrolase [Candidatus Cryptobacteroides sp.]
MKRFVSAFVSVLFFLPLAAQQLGYSVTYREFCRNLPPLDCIGRIHTASSGQFPATRWSVGCEGLDREMAVFSEYGSYVGRLGVGYARIQSGWARTEKKKGRYDYAWLDEIVDGLCSQDVNPWISLSYGNPLYGAETSLGAEIFTDEETFKAWEKYVENTVLRYKDRVHCWEIWNEPNISVNTPGMYAGLVERTSAVIRRIDPEADIAAFALASVDRAFLESVLEIFRSKGEYGLFNFVTLHKYYENPDDCDYDFALLTSLVHEFDPAVKVVMGESGCPSKLEFAHALKHHDYDEKIQAKTDLRRMACDFSAERPCSIFTMVDLVYPNMQQSFGLLRTDLQGKVIYAKPSFYAVRNMVNLLPDTIVPFSPGWDANTARGLKFTGLKDSVSGKTVGVMFYFCDNPAQSALEWESVTFTLEDFKIDNPVFVEPITGAVFDLGVFHYSPNSPDTKYTNIPVWDSPVFILSSDCLEIGSGTDKSLLNEF